MPPSKKKANTTVSPRVSPNVSPSKSHKKKTPAEEVEPEEEEDNRSEVAAALGKLVKADLLAAALANAAELAELRKAAKITGRQSSKIAEDQDDDDGEDDDSAESSDGDKRSPKALTATKRSSPKKKKQPPLSKLGERAKAVAARKKDVPVIDLEEYERWKEAKSRPATAVHAIAEEDPGTIAQ